MRESKYFQWKILNLFSEWYEMEWFMKVDWKRQYREVLMSIFEFLTQKSHFALLFSCYSTWTSLEFTTAKENWCLCDFQVLHLTSTNTPTPNCDLRCCLILYTGCMTENTIHLNLIAPFLTWGWSFRNLTVITFLLHYPPFTRKVSLLRISPLQLWKEDITLFLSWMFFLSSRIPRSWIWSCLYQLSICLQRFFIFDTWIVGTSTAVSTILHASI